MAAISPVMTSFHKSGGSFPLESQACSDSRGGNIDSPSDGMMTNVMLQEEQGEHKVLLCHLGKYSLP